MADDSTRSELARLRLTHGLGPRWAAVEALYRTECRRLGFNRRGEPARPSTFRRPERQRALFPES